MGICVFSGVSNLYAEVEQANDVRLGTPSTVSLLKEGCRQSGWFWGGDNDLCVLRRVYLRSIDRIELKV